MPESPGIAIVGAGCCYPDAPDPDRLRELVLARQRAFRPILPMRLNLDDCQETSRRTRNSFDSDTTCARLAGVRNGRNFDRAACRIPRATYRVTDLTRWLALGVADQTLRWAGFPAAPASIAIVSQS